MRSIAILGPGGVGGFLAGAFERAGIGATLIARESSAVEIARDGLRIRSVRLGDFDARPVTVINVDGPVDALLVATKSTGLESALERVDGLEPRIVLPLLNGLDHLAVLRARFGQRAVAGSIRIESTRVSTGEIEQTSPFLRIDMASADAGMSGPLEELRAALEAAEVPARVMDSEAQAMWGKLVRLNAIACATSAWDLPLGGIRDDVEKRAALESAVREGAAVAEAEGAEVDPATTIAELDAIPGAVLRAAARHGLSCPTIERLATAAARRAGIPAPVA